MDLDWEEPKSRPLLADFSTAIFYGAAEGLLFASVTSSPGAPAGMVRGIDEPVWSRPDAVD